MNGITHYFGCTDARLLLFKRGFLTRADPLHHTRALSVNLLVSKCNLLTLAHALLQKFDRITARLSLVKRMLTRWKMIRFNFKSSLFLLTLCVLVPWLTSCRTLSSDFSITPDAGWVVLPVSNLSTTPNAGESAASMIEVSLRERGVQQLAVYQSAEKLTLASVLANNNDLPAAKSWARERGYRYGITGTVHEWQYKNGTDKEPVVGLSLKLIDLADGSDRVIWQAGTAKTGWGFSNLSGVADTVIRKLLKQLPIQRPSYSATAAVNGINRNLLISALAENHMLQLDIENASTEIN